MRQGEGLLKKKTIWQKICVLRQAFTLEELAEDENAIEDIKTELRATASKFSDVMKVTLYALEQQGITTGDDPAWLCATHVSSRARSGMSTTDLLGEDMGQTKYSGRI